MKNTTTGRHETTLQREATLADQLLTDLVEATYDLDAGHVVQILREITAETIERRRAELAEDARLEREMGGAW